MDRHPSRSRGRALLLMVTWLMLFGAWAPNGATMAQPSDLDAWATAFPAALDRDLAAMALLPGDFPLTGMVTGRGHLRRPIEEAQSHATALQSSEEDLLLRMREAGWVARYVGEVVPADRETGGASQTTAWTSITAYVDADGAAEGFALLDESVVEGSEVLQARRIGDGARLSRYTGTDSNGRVFERLRYTFVSGPLVGAVALFRGDDTPEEAMTPDAMVAMAERLLARMEANADAPGLSQMVVHLDPVDGLPIDVHDEGYAVLDGGQIEHFSDTAEGIEAAEAFNARYGVEATYIAHTLFGWQEGVDHRPTWLVALYRVEDADAATDFVRQHARYDRSVGYGDLVELDALPAVDWPVAGSAYAEAWPDGTISSGYRITVAVGRTVAVVDVSGPGGVSEETAFALVEAQVTCMEMGMCSPIPAPFEPFVMPSTPAA